MLEQTLNNYNSGSNGAHYRSKPVLECMREYDIKIPGIEPCHGLRIGRHAYNVSFDNGLKYLSPYNAAKPTTWSINTPSSSDTDRFGHVEIHNPRDWDHVHRILLSLIITNSTDENFWKGILDKIALKNGNAASELSDLLQQAA